VSSNSSTSSACSESEISAPAVAESQITRETAGEIRRPAAAIGVSDTSPAAYQIPRLPAGEIRRRAIAVGERLLRAEHHRRARPAITRGRKTCRVCKIECSSAVVYREHISGRRHKSLLARKTAGVQRCDVCDISIETKAQFDTHLGGRRHRKAILDKAHCDDRAATLALAAASAPSPRAHTIPPRFRSAPLPR
jgi:Zinc-finger of C2H2 type